MKLVDTYTVNAKVTQRYAKLRKEFAAHVKEVGRKLKAKEMKINEVPVKEVSYKMTLEDSVGYKETWYESAYCNTSTIP